MTETSLQQAIFQSISQLVNHHFEIILVHGGGPFIQQTLNEAGISSEFIGGHRVTTKESLKYVEMALKGLVNGDLVRIASTLGLKPVGLSGKDGKTVIAKKRWHVEMRDGKEIKTDLGMVGDVDKIDPKLPELLLEEGYLPVFTCIASDTQGSDYNINADMFAGHLAGALKADEYIVLTDVDGLLKEVTNKDSIIQHIQLKDLGSFFHKIIKGGMIPKVESCKIAVQNGAIRARILNGTKPRQLCDSLIKELPIGTTITR